MNENYVIEMIGISKSFGDLKANDDITLQLKKGEIHALLGENGAGKSTLMSILFGLYNPDSGIIKKDGNVVKINNPNDATKLNIGMVHQHFKLVEVFSVVDNIILGCEPCKYGFIKQKEARKKVIELSEKYGLSIDPDAIIENITVGMQQRVEILKMLYRDNDILIFDEPTAILTPQEITELMQIMKNLVNEGKSILFISHKLNEIMEVSDRITVLRKGQLVGTVNKSDTTIEKLSEMMVGRPVQFEIDKKPADVKDVVLEVKNLYITDKIHKNLAVKDVSFNVRAGEIVTIAGIDGNGQSELIYGITGLDKIDFYKENKEPTNSKIILCGKDITNVSIRERNTLGLSHIPEDRHKHGLILDYNAEKNIVLQRYFEPEFQKYGFLKNDAVTAYANRLIETYDVRSGQGGKTIVRSMSGGNQQKLIISREMEKEHKLLIAVQPTRGLDIGAIEFIHNNLIKERDKGLGILLVSFELDEVMNLSDRILVMYEGEIVGEFDPKEVTTQELGLYMSGAKRREVNESKS